VSGINRIDRSRLRLHSRRLIFFLKNPGPEQQPERPNNFSCVLTVSCVLLRLKFDAGETYVRDFLSTGCIIYT
jgi:hypothetical protein